MQNLFKIYVGMGIYNAVVLFPYNVYNGYKRDKIVLNYLRSENDDVFTKVTNNMIFMPLSTYYNVIFCSIKSAFYLSLGPIGTYRGLLAVKNYQQTNDYGWIRVLVEPLSSSDVANTPYIMKPFGKASWYPVSVQK